METCAHARRLWTYPNGLTLLRPVWTGPFVWLCDHADQSAALWSRMGACLVFGLIVASDMLDGWMARRLRQESPLGRVLDHTCDVLFILTALGFFVTLRLVPWWLPAAITWAFGLYMLHSWWLTASQSQPTLVGSRLGHLGGVLNYGAVGLVTAQLCLGQAVIPAPLLQGCFMALALLAWVSGAERLYHLLLRSRRVSRGAPKAKRPNRSDYLAP